MTRLLCVVVLAACGSTASAPAHPGARTGRSASEPPPAHDHPPASHRSAAECDRLIAHAVTIGSTERPADQQLTADERSALERDLRATWTPKCSAMTTRGYDCALAAQSLAELDACGG